MNMSNFERKLSPGYRHMICIGKTKSTSEKGLLLGWLRVVPYFGEGEKSGTSACTRARLEPHATRNPTPGVNFIKVLHL